MTVRTAYPGLESVGDVLTTTNFDKLPGGWIGYAEVSADQGTITSIVDLTSLSVTVMVNTSRRIRVTGYVAFAGTVNANNAGLYVRESSTTLALSAHVLDVSTVTYQIPPAIWVGTPSAGSHTYKLSAALISGSGSITTKASATALAFILVEDLGPAS